MVEENTLKYDGENIMSEQSQDKPWLDVRCKKEVMDHLWNIIDIPATSRHNKNTSTTPEVTANSTLAGNISKSKYIQDKDNWFYEKILKRMSEYMHFKNSWGNYYDVLITKSKSPPIFELRHIWVNYQKQYEFNPAHAHDGIYSFVVFMKIPTHWKAQHALPFSANSNSPFASDFQFLLGHEKGLISRINIPLSPEDEGRMLFFPAWLTHAVYPFYGTEEERITISGNILFQEQQPKYS